MKKKERIQECPYLLKEDAEDEMNKEVDQL
jgi:hypothetical protein